MPTLQFRWNEEMGMAELIEKSGKMWVTNGIVRSCKTYSSIEETLYLMELGASHLLDNRDRTISLIKMYEKGCLLAGRGDVVGSCLRFTGTLSLGYIIRRHDVAWSLKSIRSSHKPIALEGTEESSQLEETGSMVELSINKLFGELKISDLKPDFDVYLPKSSFRKSSPGDPNFLLYLSRSCNLCCKWAQITTGA